MALMYRFSYTSLRKK